MRAPFLSSLARILHIRPCAHPSHRPLQVVAEGVSHSSSLTELNLNHNKFLDEGVAAVVAALTSCRSAHPEGKRLVTLKLAGTGMTSAGASALAPYVAASDTLATLELGVNALGDDGAAALAGGLASNCSLTQLNLNGNALTTAGWFAVSVGAVAEDHAPSP